MYCAYAYSLFTVYISPTVGHTADLCFLFTIRSHQATVNQRLNEVYLDGIYLVQLVMPPPTTRLKASTIEPGSKSDRKRNASEMVETDLDSLSGQINVLTGVCENTFKIVDELKIVVANLLAENVRIRDELKKLQQVHVLAPVHDVQPRVSYASAVKSKAVVVVRPKDSSQDSSLTKKALREKVVHPSNSTVCNVRNTARGGIVIECDNLEGTNIIQKDISTQLGDSYVVSVPTKRPTKIRIVGMSEQLSAEDITKSILAQNSELFEENHSLEVVSTFKIKENVGAKLVLDSDSFNKIMETSKLRIGWDVCRVYEAFDVVRCFNCSGYHHLAKNCTSTKRCPRCAGEHTSLDCKSTTECCCNCTAAMTSLKITLDTNHSAWSSNCPVYQRKIRSEQRRTNYKN